MEFERMREGALYVVRGRGVMRFAGEGSPASARFLAHGNGSYWASAEDALRAADWHDVDAYQADAKVRGVACEDRTCWCRRRT